MKISRYTSFALPLGGFPHQFHKFVNHLQQETTFSLENFQGYETSCIYCNLYQQCVSKQSMQFCTMQQGQLGNLMIYITQSLHTESIAGKFDIDTCDSNYCSLTMRLRPREAGQKEIEVVRRHRISFSTPHLVALNWRLDSTQLKVQLGSLRR